MDDVGSFIFSLIVLTMSILCFVLAIVVTVMLLRKSKQGPQGIQGYKGLQGAQGYPGLPGSSPSNFIEVGPQNGSMNVNLNSESSLSPGGNYFLPTSFNLNLILYSDPSLSTMGNMMWINTNIQSYCQLSSNGDQSSGESDYWLYQGPEKIISLAENPLSLMTNRLYHIVSLGPYQGGPSTLLAIYHTSTN